jgi:hypothetical protein
VIDREQVAEALARLDMTAAAAVDSEEYWLVPWALDAVLAAAQAWLDQGDVLVTDEMIERAALAMQLDGWTCDGHEPEPCAECDRVLPKSVRVILDAALSDRSDNV